MSAFKIEVVVLDGEDEIPEDQILEHFAKAPDSFDDYTTLEGLVTFVIDSERVTVEDALSYILPALALETVPELLSEGKSKLILYTSPVNFDLQSDGTTVTLTGNYLTEPLRFPQDELVTESLNACERFITWAEKIWPDQGFALPRARATLTEVEQELRPKA